MNYLSIKDFVTKYGLTSRERPTSASYLRLKNIQGTTTGKTWKKFFQKKWLKSNILPKNPKRDHLGLLNVFYKPKISKNSREFPLIEFKNFRKNVAKCRKKPQRGTLWSPIYFWKHKNLWFSARLEPPLSCFSDPRKSG